MNFDSPTGQASKAENLPMQAREILLNPELPGKVAAAIIKKIDKYVDDHQDYMSGYNYEDLLVEACFNLRGAVRLPNKEDKPEDLGIRYDQEGIADRHDSSGPGENRGVVYFQDEPIMTYGSDGEGYGMTIEDWDEAALGRAVNKYLERLKSEAG